jgi:anti-anti-sigma factor
MPRDPVRWRLEVDHSGPVTVARVIHLETLTESDVQALGDKLLALVQAGPRKLLLDLSGAKALSSSMLGKVLALYKRAKAQGGNFALCGISPQLRESLDALQLTRLFPAFENCDQGVAALSNGT